ncbi:MAG: hypothetical protein ACRDBG_07815 [Waterburya sp.]
MTKTKLYAIVDEDDRVLGSWGMGYHWVFLYDRQEEAEEAAISLKLPEYKICNAVEAMQRKPSKRSE